MQYTIGRDVYVMQYMIGRDVRVVQHNYMIYHSDG